MSEERSPWQLGGLTWKELGGRVWAEMNDDDIWGRSAQMAYYFLLALFPLLFFLTSIIGIAIGSGSGLRHGLFNYLAQVLPPSAYELVSNTMREVSTSSGGDKITFGLLAALWAASNGMGAISESLNAVYDVKEGRPWWKARLTSVGLTIALAVLVITALVLVLYGGSIAETVAGYFGLGQVFETAWKILQWPIVLAFLMLAFALIYYFAPDIKEQKWQWITPGSVVGVGLWLLVSLAFRLYLSYFDSYSATYGSLGAVIILMLWFYLTGAAILIGGEFNAEIENAAAEKGEATAKGRGEKAPGAKEGSTAAVSATGEKRAPATPKSAPPASSAPRPLRTRRSLHDLTAGKVALALVGWAAAKLWPFKSHNRL